MRARLGSVAAARLEPADGRRYTAARVHHPHTLEDKKMNKPSAATIQYLRCRLTAVTNDLLRERSRPIPNSTAIAALLRKRQEIETRLAESQAPIAA
jgi:hypothetical protein